MKELIIVIITALMSWYFLDTFYYSPKEQIKRLRKRMFMYKVDFNKLKDLTGDGGKLEESDQKTKKLINALIDEYLDEEKDTEFIKENRF